MDKSVLMVAFHFPPAAMSSGHLRTLGFARHLPDFGWTPVVLSARPLAYPRTAPVADDVIPPGCMVSRALAFDVSRHFSIRGKYPGLLAQPDRWSSWWPAAVVEGLRLIRRHKIRAIWSTYPIMTAHCIAHTLQRLTGLPWIADFRDPVANSVEAGNPYSVASQQHWERRVLGRATHAVFTTPGARRDYAERYPDAARDGRLSVVGNGYDEAAFADLPPAPAALDGRPLRLVHSGLLYPQGRDPAPFFAALARLKADTLAGPGQFQVVLRASGWEAGYQREIDRLGIADIVTLAPPIGNRQALLEQAEADAVVLFQGERFDRQIPAKVYEYLRVGRPIFALVGLAGDTARVLRDTGGAAIVPLDDVEAIASRLAQFVGMLRTGRAPGVAPDILGRYSRREGARLLAGLLEGTHA